MIQKYKKKIMETPEIEEEETGIIIEDEDTGNDDNPVIDDIINKNKGWTTPPSALEGATRSAGLSSTEPEPEPEPEPVPEPVPEPNVSIKKIELSKIMPLPLMENNDRRTLDHWQERALLTGFSEDDIKNKTIGQIKAMIMSKKLPSAQDMINFDSIRNELNNIEKKRKSAAARSITIDGLTIMGNLSGHTITLD